MSELYRINPDHGGGETVSDWLAILKAVNAIVPVTIDYEAAYRTGSIVEYGDVMDIVHAALGIGGDDEAGR